ncbi:MAG: CoA-binding protein [Reichenbachiella sp.]
MRDLKHTVVIGASTNPGRYAYMAANRLFNAGHPISFVSIKRGELFGQPFKDLRTKPMIDNVDTVTLYIGTRNLEEWNDYIISLKPKRIIFNPGTEHDGLAEEAEKKGIEVIEGCTLVMLSAGQY